MSILLFSKSCIYGIRASVFLAASNNKEYISIRQMSEKLDISFHFLTKILQNLTAAGLMQSQKGPSGGIRLAQADSEVSIIQIVVAIDGDDLFTECVLGLPGCGTQEPCPLHEQWSSKRDRLQEMLELTTLKELATKGKSQNLRITADGGFLWE